MLSVSAQVLLVVVLGAGAQWVAWSIGVPSIVTLLAAGLLAGPVTGLLEVDAVVPAPLLAAVVPMAVALILFEGGLTLRFQELRTAGTIVVRLALVGMVVTGAATALLVHWLFDLPPGPALLLGAVLSVSGPTVIGPLLREVRPAGHVGSILKWEAIVLDPVGAIVAAVVFELLVAEASHATPGAVVLHVARTLVVGGVLGLGSRSLLLSALRRGWIAESHVVVTTLALVVGIAAVGNALAPESGLVAVTVLGVFLANQRRISIEAVEHFYEQLTQILVSALFVVLAARLPGRALLDLLWPEGLVFLAAMVLVVRPLAIGLATLGTQLDRASRLFLAAVYPRGIVAASLASLLGMRLVAAGIPGGESLEGIAYVAIVGLVVVYGLAAPRVANALALTDRRTGLLIVGANRIGRELARAVQATDVPVRLVDTSYRRVTEARLDGLTADALDVLTEHGTDALEVAGIGRLLAVTPNDDVNSLAALAGASTFGRRGAFQLAPEPALGPGQGPRGHRIRGRIAFDPALTFAAFDEALRAGATLKRTSITNEFREADFRDQYGADAIPLLVVRPGHGLELIEAGERPRAPAGSVLVSLVRPSAAAAEARSPREPAPCRTAPG